ncbi:MAG: 8-amino-7-oxononanoate synthase [Nitrospinae bacterium]|nr:8-amino-7-oxononanoate synthase [Nitrospinota bacterium]
MDFIDDELAELKREGLYRELKIIEGEQGNRVRIGGREVILLSSNNYLGLASHPEIKKAAVSAIEKFGCGSGASRLISGSMELHKELEEKIASFKKTESAILFNSGYTANLGVLSSICGKGDVIFCDKLNHASIIDGCLLSGAELKRYPHKDIDALEKFLKKSSGFKKRLIVTDGIFSMDGDIAPLKAIVLLAKRYSAILMVDDAHATGILGKNGRGTGEYFGLNDSIDIIMGTLSKAVGSFGGFVAGRKKLIEFLINRARSFIYTTSLPPSVIASSIAAIDIIEKGDDLRDLLWKNVRYLKDGLKNIGFDIMGSESQIIPVFVGDTHRAVEMSQMLLKEGVFVQGIRPPTVPHGKSRLRVTVMATHSKADLDAALESFEKAGKKLEIV